ncbi:MAG: pyridoxamine 5'-phosphate oxidase family protein [Clostridiales bacterium]|nr:pyridoxamine 5'-phosphate oxidase family protein [Clostridiales bacterium]
MKPSYRDRIDEASIAMMDCDSKVGVLATEDESGYPHLSFISSIQALGDDSLTFGQFSAGLSKRFIMDRPRVGFLVLSADKRYLSGNATYTHSANTGKEFDRYNNKPLFRYNSYMGFYRVFYLNLDRISALKPLPMGAIVFGAILSRIKALFVAKSGHDALPLVGRKLFSQLDSLKFLCWYDEKGEATLLPVVQATSAGSDRIALTGVPFGKALSRIPDGAKASILCLNLQMESVLVKGRYHGGTLDIERVYNSMPPKMEYVYPRSEAIEPVRSF